MKKMIILISQIFLILLLFSCDDLGSKKEEEKECLKMCDVMYFYLNTTYCVGQPVSCGSNANNIYAFCVDSCGEGN